MTFDEYWQEAQHHVNAEYHAALEVWKAARENSLIEAVRACHGIAFDQRRSSLATDGALMCKGAIEKILKGEQHEL